METWVFYLFDNTQYIPIFIVVIMDMSIFSKKDLLICLLYQREVLVVRS
jgi:hypothetical protein